MRIHDCRVGMNVVFGGDRYDGLKTRGTVVKINRTKAKVRSIEQRGKHPVGAVWSVPYSMMDEVTSVSVVENSLSDSKYIVYNKINGNYDNGNEVEEVTIKCKVKDDYVSVIFSDGRMRIESWNGVENVVLQEVNLQNSLG
jgi:hypothetical protein